MLHVEYLELAEVAGDDPARALGVRQAARIALRLLVRFQQRAVRLLDRRVEVFSQALLLDHRVRRGDHHVDVADVRELHALFEAHKLRRIFDAVHRLQELDPKPLAVLLLIADARPLLRERRRRCRLPIHKKASFVSVTIHIRRRCGKILLIFVACHCRPTMPAIFFAM